MKLAPLRQQAIKYWQCPAQTARSLRNLSLIHILETKVERGNRVFPVTDRSLDVVQALEKYMRQNRVALHLESQVEHVVMKEGKVTGIRLKNQKELPFDAVIVTTGGLSYPNRCV